MTTQRGYDVRWTFGGGIAVGFIGMTAFPSASYEVLVVAGLLIVASGVALALDFHNAIDRWLSVVTVMPRSRLSPRTFAKVTGGWTALLGLVVVMGAVGMLIAGETPS